MHLLIEVAYSVFCLLMFASAFVGWRRTRFWWLVLLAIAPLLLAAGEVLRWTYSIVVVMNPGQRQLPPEHVNVAHAIGLWIRFSGWIAAGVGGLAAIRGAIKRPADEMPHHAH